MGAMLFRREGGGTYAQRRPRFRAAAFVNDAVDDVDDGRERLPFGATVCFKSEGLRNGHTPRQFQCLGYITLRDPATPASSDKVKVVLVRDPSTYEDAAYRMANFLDYFQPTRARWVRRWDERVIPEAPPHLCRDGVAKLRHGRLPTA